MYYPFGKYIFHFSCVGAALFSRAASSQVFSALMSLTSVFGMGTGGPSPPLAPTRYIIHQNTLEYNTKIKFFHRTLKTE